MKIAAISYDAPEILSGFAQKYSIGYPLLSDRGSEVIRRFGIFNENMAPELRSYGVPHPVEYLISPDGVVAKKYFVENYQHRVSASAVALEQFEEASPGAPVITFTSRALRATIGFPSHRAFAGQEIRFFARLTLQPGWHVYGEPLPENYTPVSVAFESPAIQRQEVHFPTPEMVVFPLLSESLPAYSGAFEIQGRLLLRFPLPEGETVLRGNLRFQQCSESVCEPPQTLTFELSLQIEPFVISDADRNRAAKK